MELDDVLVVLGDFGCYQTLVYVSICLAGQVPSAWHMLAVSFLGAAPAHHCQVPPGQRLEDTVPPDPEAVAAPGGGSPGPGQAVYVQCEQYANRSVDNATVACQDGWQYGDTYGETIATEWDLVCDKDGSVELSQTVFMAGVMVGSLVFGHLSDRFGRRYVFFLSLWAQVAFGVGAAFTGSLYAFVALRFFVGVIEQGVDITSFVMVTEMFSPFKRTLAGMLLAFFWATGVMSLPGLAYALRDWRHLQLAISLPSLLTIPLWWLIPESVRWLMSRGRAHEAEAILRRMARFNKVELPEKLLTSQELPFRRRLSAGDVDKGTAADHEGQRQPGRVGPPSTLEGAPSPSQADRGVINPGLVGTDAPTDDGVVGGRSREGPAEETAGSQEARVYTLWHLFRTPRIRKISLVMLFTWFVNSLVYYGLALNTGNLAGDPYLNFFLSGAVEVPSYVVSTAAVTWIGRRVPLCVFHVAGGIACIATAFIPQITEQGTDLSALIVTTAMLGKFGIAGSYAIVFLYATELFPTVVRNLGVGTASFSSRVGGILAPIIMYLGKFAGWLPLVVLGGMSVAAGFSVLMLEETAGKRQPQTIEEVEANQGHH